MTLVIPLPRIRLRETACERVNVLFFLLFLILWVTSVWWVQGCVCESFVWMLVLKHCPQSPAHIILHLAIDFRFPTLPS